MYNNLNLFLEPVHAPDVTWLTGVDEQLLSSNILYLYAVNVTCTFI